ncbi:juvenile hormone epoxide hydrolase-like isoform X1 [Vanessa atalanta]|uniref:juvenile hormone epoxide hydrolase-like isoform X1 n=2 Tax=Vanessa atalanta TaxID=42275 RepID=UPI001FCCF6D7|nr:juvenile hormone epoxide hydrolase-like isoform X1 [Vanessa atalanta]
MISLIILVGFLLRSKMGRLILAVLVALASVLIYFLYLRSPPPLPEIDLEEWWGTELSKSKQDDSIKPFKVDFNEVMIKDLKDRLRDRHPLAPPLKGVAFEYGFNSKQLEGWLKYWAEEYSFKERENFFNNYPHFKTDIQGLSIHFVRVTPEVPPGVEVIPLLLLHGWPGSVREFYEAIPYLTSASRDRDFALELIIPSLPGYGFSSGAKRPGLGADKVAVVFRNLMHRLGFKKYYIQGGDWGALITSCMATFFPDEVLGYHSNMPFIMSPKVTLITLIGALYPPLVVGSNVQDRMYPMLEKYANIIEETGYMHIQSTKPDTIGVALSDSPTGLAAYILEKFSTWTQLSNRKATDGALTKQFSRDQLLDNLMVYWSSNSITTSMRLYAETFNKRYLGLGLEEIPTNVPAWFIQAKNELTYTPIWALKTKYPNIINETILDDGGHFLAFQLPEIFSNDVIKAIQSFRAWHKNNKKTEL